MPMVGTGTASVIIAAMGAGMPSRTMLKQPAATRARASSMSSLAASAVLPWILNPPKAAELWGVSPK